MLAQLHEEGLFLRQKWQHVQMEAETGNLNIGMSEASAFGLERAGLYGFVFAVSIVCVTS